MKTLVTASLLAAFSLGVFGQGQIILNNHVPGTVEAPVSRPDGTGAGAGISAELMLVEPGDNLVPLGPPTTFRTSTAAATYYVNPIMVTVPGFLPGAIIIVRLVAFDGKDFDSSTLKGESSDISVTLGGGVILPPDLVGLTGFTLSSDGSPPVITTNPQSQTAAVAASVTFSVLADGSAPLTYQWQRNGQDITGATDSSFTLSPILPTDAAHYRVVVHNAVGSATSPDAILTLIAPAHVTVPLQDLTVALGGSAMFSVQASGLGLKYQWQHDGTDILGATQASLKFDHVKAADAGSYRVVVSDAAGKDSSMADLIIGGASFVHRQLPSGYSSGVKLIVTLTAQPDLSTQAYVIEDVPPAGWTVGTISNDGTFDSVNQMVKFGPILDPGARSFTYELVPPATATEVGHFKGTAVADGLTSRIEGNDSLSPMSFHPADSDPADGRLTATEVTAYAAAWKHGAKWATGPNPIPPSYVSRAGTLWRGGEFYKLDTKVASGPPRWWVNTTSSHQTLPQAIGSQVALDSTDSAKDPLVLSMPDKYVPGLAVTIEGQVTPPEGTLSYVVEINVPSGWTVADINEDGLFDATTQSIKWGVFFDKEKRDLSFQLLPPADSTGPLQLTGVASFDGQDVDLSAGPPSVASSKLGHLHRNQHGDLDLDLTGAAGQTYAIEVSTDLIHWTQLKTFHNLNGLLGFEDSNASALKQKFFRAVLIP